MRLKTLKIPLKHILNDQVIKTKLDTIIKRTNIITYNVYYFLRLYILELFTNEKDIPLIDCDFIMAIYKTITTKSQGPKNQNIVLMTKLENFYNSNYKVLFDNIIKYESKNLSCILIQEAKLIEINYKNNIIRNFSKYLIQYIKEEFGRKFKKSCVKIIKNKKVFDEKLYYSDLKKVKIDIVNDSFDCDIKYHKWIKKTKINILPIKQKDCDLHKDIELNYHKYLKYMLIMNGNLEKHELKLFQPLPIRTSVKDCHITLNTNALIDVFVKGDFIHESEYGIENVRKSEILKNVSKYQYNLWRRYFNLHKDIKLTDYSFNYEIKTDGKSVSLSFIHNDDIEKKQKTIQNKKNKKNINKAMYEGKTFAEKEKIKNTEKEAVKKQKIDSYNNYKKEQEKIKEPTIKKKTIKNFTYIEDFLKDKTNRLIMSKNLPILEKLKQEYEKQNIKKLPFNKKIYEINKIKKANNYNPNKNQNIVFIDPGKRTLLYMMSQDGLYYRYNNKRRLAETKRLKYNKLLLNKKKKLKINNKTIEYYENLLKDYKLKTQNIESFKKIIKLKLKIKNLIDSTKEGCEYNEYLKKHCLNTHINTIKHEDKIIKEIQNLYGKNAIMVIGDWSGDSHGIRYISTPSTALKNRFKKHFKTYLIDEFCTSKLNYKTEEENKKLKLKIKTHTSIKIKEFHSILTYKLRKSNEKGIPILECIDRDKNSVNNMKKIFQSLLDTGKRPKNYTYTEPKKPAETKEPLDLKNFSDPLVKSISSVRQKAIKPLKKTTETPIKVTINRKKNTIQDV